MESQKISYSYDIYNKLGRVEGHPINKERYDQIIIELNELKHTFIKIKSWKTEYKESTLYGSQYKNKNGEMIFLWKEVFE